MKGIVYAMTILVHEQIECTLNRELIEEQSGQGIAYFICKKTT